MKNVKDKYIFPIIVALSIAILPQVLRLPIWIVIWCALFWGYLLLSVKYQLPLPGRSLQTLFPIFGLAGILITYRHMIGGLAFFGLLAVMAGLKPLEIRTYRDRMVTVFIAYFLVITSLLEFENLAMTLYLFFSVLIITAILIYINCPKGRFTDNLRHSATIMVQALPLMLALFFLFPRLRGNFLGTIRQATGKTGFTETLALGDVAKLVFNDETAFRVEFKGPVPAQNLLYWRGVVFWHFDGNSWNTTLRIPKSRKFIQGKNPVEYNITLEPHSKLRIFSLDVPVFSPGRTKMLSDFSLMLKRPLKKKFRYRLKSFTSYSTGDFRIWEKAALQLPPFGNKKARMLAGRWRNESSSPEEIVEKAGLFFKENNFKYNLQPSDVRRDPIDNFLFITKNGFCEHYASSFAFLMRAAGVPSRVIGGYMGGTDNPFGNYIIVRQSDAHAWTEVWLAGKGWVRVDPTSFVAPERISDGVAGAVAQEELPSFLQSENNTWALDFWATTRLRWDAISTKWDIVFVGYSYIHQKAFFSYLKGFNLVSNIWIKVSMIVACFFLILVTTFLVRRIYKTGGKKDSVQELYMKFCSKLAKTGLPKKPSQGPLDYIKMIGSRNKNIRDRATDVIDLYILLRYGKGADRKILKEFKTKVNNWSN